MARANVGASTCKMVYLLNRRSSVRDVKVCRQPSGMSKGTIRKASRFYTASASWLTHFRVDSPPDRLFRYFSTSSSLSINAWSTDGKDSLTRCGHCDNCTRPPESIERRDVTVQAWQLVKIVEAIAAEGGRVTLGMLADLARGAGGGAFGVGGRKGKEKVGLDLKTICQGKVDMSRDVGLARCFVSGWLVLVPI